MKLAAWLWVSNAQYFIIQVITALAWSTGFSLRNNFISDLGNSVCGMYGGRFVCSPQHGLMNLSFVVLGVSQFFGAWLLAKAFKVKGKQWLGFIAMMAAGFGTILVGLYPENAAGNFHLIGASLPFLIGNIGPFLIAMVLARHHQGITIYSIFTSVIGLFGLLLFLTHHFLVFGAGGMERIVAYPQTIWMIIFGVHILSQQKQTIALKQPQDL